MFNALYQGYSGASMDNEIFYSLIESLPLDIVPTLQNVVINSIYKKPLVLRFHKYYSSINLSELFPNCKNSSQVLDKIIVSFNEELNIKDAFISAEIIENNSLLYIQILNSIFDSNVGLIKYYKEVLKASIECNKSGKGTFYNISHNSIVEDVISNYYSCMFLQKNNAIE